jgi:multidrug resistance efflux pump
MARLAEKEDLDSSAEKLRRLERLVIAGAVDRTTGNRMYDKLRADARTLITELKAMHARATTVIDEYKAQQKTTKDVIKRARAALDSRPV